MIKKISRVLFQFLPEEFWLIIILLPAIPAILYIDNERVRNILYLILVPIGVMNAGILFISLKKRGLIEQSENKTAPELSLNNSNQNELVIDKDKLNP
jgi:hypothetical protein